MCRIRRHSRLAAGIAATLMLASSQLWVTEVQAAVVQFNIESQPLAKALNSWADQSGLQVIWPSGHPMAYSNSTPIEGRLEPLEALRRLLENTGLAYSVMSGGQMVAIHGRERKVGLRTSANVVDMLAVAEADAQRPEAGPTSAANGDSTARGLTAPEASTSTESAKGSGVLDEIIVTGSHFQQRGQETSAPVIVLTRERIEQLGVSNVADVLSYVPQQAFSVNEANSIAGSRTVRLRGLGLGTTLILINGRRTVTSALQASANTFDLNAIPLSAVDRIEVLSDSASAVYGADAVGGVVNVILKDEIGRPELNLYYGTADDGAEERRASVPIGFATERLRATVVFDYFDRDFLHGGDRDLTENQDYRRFGSIDRRVALGNPGNVTSLSAANLPGLPTRNAAVPEGSTGVGLTSADFLATAGQTNLESISRFGSPVPKARSLSGLATLKFDVTDRSNIFAELLYAERDNESLLFPPFIIGVVPASNAFNPFGVPVLAQYLATDLPSGRSIAESDSLRAVAGFRGQRGAWDWELSVLNSTDNGSLFRTGALDVARQNAALASNDPNQALNLFIDGPAGSPALLNSLFATPIVDRSASDAEQATGLLRGTLFDLPAGPAQIALGGEMRSEEIHFRSSGLGLDLKADRDTSAAYTELRLPILGGKVNTFLGEQVALTLAGRYDDYSDFGGSFNAQYGVLWKPISALLLRASYGTSFRPPSLYELYQPARTQLQPVVDPQRNGERVIAAVRSGGNPALKPEESDSFTVGFVFTPGWTYSQRFSASYWEIAQEQRVQALNPLLDETLFASRVQRAVPTPADIAAGRPGVLVGIDTTSANFGELTTSGVDLEFSSAFDTRAGRFAPTIAATWVDRFEDALVPNAPANNRVGVANTQGSIAKWRGTATLSWSRNALSLSGTGRYVSSYRDVTSGNVANGRKLGSQMLADVQATLDIYEALGREFQFLSGLSLRLGVLNVFDRAPDFAEVGGANGYDPSQADLRQRFGYASVVAEF